MGDYGGRLYSIRIWVVVILIVGGLILNTFIQVRGWNSLLSPVKAGVVEENVVASFQVIDSNGIVPTPGGTMPLASEIAEQAAEVRAERLQEILGMDLPNEFTLDERTFYRRLESQIRSSASIGSYYALILWGIRDYHVWTDNLISYLSALGYRVELEHPNDRTSTARIFWIK